MESLEDKGYFFGDYTGLLFVQPAALLVDELTEVRVLNVIVDHDVHEVGVLKEVLQILSSPDLPGSQQHF